MSSKLRYDLAGALGRLYRTRTEILGVAEAAVAAATHEAGAKDFDPADIPEGTPRAVWLTTLIKLATTGNHRAIAELLEEAARRSLEEDWSRFDQLARAPKGSSSTPPTDAPSFERAELDVRWAGETGSERRLTMVASTRVWLELTVTVTWDGTKTIDQTRLVCDNKPVRLWQVGTTAILDDMHVATYRGIVPFTPRLRSLRHIDIEWSGVGAGDDTRTFRRLIHRTNARIANLVWLVAVLVIPIVWLFPFGFFPTMIVSLGSTSVAAILAFGIRVFEWPIQSWIRESLVMLRRSMMALGVSVVILAAATPFAFREIINTTDSPIDLHDGTVIPPRSTTTRWWFDSSKLGPPYEVCSCSVASCPCSGRTWASRWAKRWRVSCPMSLTDGSPPRQDCVNKHERAGGGRVSYPFGAAIRPIQFEVGSTATTMRARPDVATAVNMPTVAISIPGASEALALPVPVSDRLAIEFEAAGLLTCSGDAARILPLRVDAASGELPTFSASLDGTLSTWTWAPGSNESARICAGRKPTMGVFAELGIRSCTGPVERLGLFRVDPVPKGPIVFHSDRVVTKWKALEEKRRNPTGRGWVCLSRSTHLRIETELYAGFSIDLPEETQTVTLVDSMDAGAAATAARVAAASAATAQHQTTDKPVDEDKKDRNEEKERKETHVSCAKRLWLISLPPKPFEKIGDDIRITRIEGRELGVACTTKDEPTLSMKKGERTCSIDATRMSCTSTGIWHHGDCVLTGGNQIVKGRGRCTDDQRVPENSYVESSVQLDAKRLGMDCKRVFRCD